jgi:demethylmenaquinone methyltransferase / 2-methoxy-6-polyprenyl-1,4-benzoquinol methylase
MEEKAKAVRELFGHIAPRYDLLNHLLSANIDKRWRRFTVSQLADVLARPNARVLDVCCGTADLSLELSRLVPAIGIDFCHSMLVIGNEKIARHSSPVCLLEGDAMSLPFPDGSFDAATCAFGLRNLADTRAGLLEFRRVLKPGGRVAILEFSQPVLPLFRQLFQFYFHRILPLIGGAISGSMGAYRYLPASVEKFPDQEGLAQLMRQSDYQKVHYFNLTGGIAALHLGEAM